MRLHYESKVREWFIYKMMTDLVTIRPKRTVMNRTCYRRVDWSLHIQLHCVSTFFNSSVEQKKSYCLKFSITNYSIYISVKNYIVCKIVGK